MCFIFEIYSYGILVHRYDPYFHGSKLLNISYCYSIIIRRRFCQITANNIIMQARLTDIVLQRENLKTFFLEGQIFLGVVFW